MKHLVISIAVLSYTGCFKPGYRDCDVSCASGHGCPSGLRCDQTLSLCRTETAGPTCGSVADDAATGADARIDPPDGALACWPIVPTNFDPCSGAFPPPTQGTFTNGSIDTDLGTYTVPMGAMTAFGTPTTFNGAPILLVHVSALTIAADIIVTVRGATPLVIVSDDTADIDGELSADGAVAVPAPPCTATSGAPGTGISSSGGGGGGLASKGGPGGRSGNTNTGGGLGGGVVPIGPLGALTPGCPGMNAGASGHAPGGTGGRGGGAIEISARSTITVRGTIHAHGLGGGGGNFSTATPCNGSTACNSGGGGGGAGGAIVLESALGTTITGTGKVCAGGGGGGEGSLNNGMLPLPADGQVGLCTDGAGGNANTGADGGAGSITSATGIAGTGGAGSPIETSGGGGGGGAGRIHAHGPISAATVGVVAPPAQ